MTYDQYWNGDPMLCKYYRKAHEIKQEEKNTELWLQGMYIYEALCDVSPVLHAFAKKGTKPESYSDKPYALTNKAREKAKEDKEKAAYDKRKLYMETIMAKHNSKFKNQSQPK